MPPTTDNEPATGGEPEMLDPAALDEWMAFGEPDRPPIPERRRVDPLEVVAAVLAVLTVAVMIALWPSGSARSAVDERSAIGLPSEFRAATVVDLEQAPCQGAPDSTCTTVGFRLEAGPDATYVFRQTFPEGSTTPAFALGEVAILSYRTPNATVADAGDGPCSFDDEAVCRSLSLTVETNAGPLTVVHELAPGNIGGGLTIGDVAVVDFFGVEADADEVLSVTPADPAVLYQFADFQRRSVLVWLTIAFVAVVVLLGRLRGAMALAGLAASVAVLLMFVLPAILEGKSPVLVAVVGSAAVAYLALYLAHGFTRMTSVAVIGTLAALALTAGLSALSVSAARFTGLVSEESSLLTLFGTIDVRGLLLAGIVLGTAGALDDVTVTQASAVWELKAANPALGVTDLFRRGLRIGRDHIASTVNTLLLAYAGASLPLMVLFVLSEQSLGTVANSEVVAVEAVRTLVGSIGLVAAVPFTTWLAATVADGSHVAEAARV